MAKPTLKQKLVLAIEPIPMEATRKQNLIAALEEINEPFSPAMLEQLSWFIILLDFNNAIQNNNSLNEVETDLCWQGLRNIYEELKNFKKNRKNRIEAQMDKNKLIQVIQQLIQYNLGPSLTNELNKGQVPSSSQKRG
ncbi:MAG: hypothetical protein ACYCQI_01425 [Gammaproteobacteria bacterium]